MDTILNILHLSDLHCGHASDTSDYPRIKTLIINDLKRNIEKYGNIDLVLFTGDIVFSGNSDEYEQASQFLEYIWHALDFHTNNTYFLCVPGNHDLSRCNDAIDSTSMVLQEKYFSDKKIANAIFDKKSQYRKFVEERFYNYTRWKWYTELYKPQLYTIGDIPGDFSCIIKKNGFSLGIIGLNSSFMHFYSGSAYKKIDISTKQILAVTQNDPDKWCENVDIAIITTHHGVDWLQNKSEENFLQNIYTQDRFYFHLHGHMHQQYGLDEIKGGHSPRSYRQSSSLFGSEETAEGAKRKYGYVIYQYEFKKILPHFVERIIPRKIDVGNDGTQKFIPDYGYNIIDDKLELTHDKYNWEKQHSSIYDDIQQFSQQELGQGGISRDIGNAVVSLFQKSIPKEPHSSTIRTGELEIGVSALSNGNYIWINSDWGMGKEGFINALINRMVSNKCILKIDIDCEETLSKTDMLTAIEKQTGLSIQELAINLQEEIPTFFIFNNISSELSSCNSSELLKLHKILSDINKNTYSIFCTTSHSAVNSESVIDLKPLDRNDTALYVENNPKWKNLKLDEDTLDVIFSRTNGVPMLIEHVANQLRYVDISQINTASFNISNFNEPIPAALHAAYANLEYFEKKEGSRTLSLLNILSLLPHGEHLSKIKRVYHTKPLFPTQAEELEKLSMIEILYKPAFFILSGGVWLACKKTNEPILKVPRQIREYILAKLPKRKKIDIIHRLAGLYFGENWRIGSIKRADNNEHNTETENKYEILRQIISSQQHEDEVAKPAMRLIVSYCDSLRSKGRYRDVITLARDFESVLNVFDPDLYAKFQLNKAKSLRMLGRHDECKDILDNLISDGNLGKGDLASAYLHLALSNQSEGDLEGAKEAALKTIKNTKKESGANMDAQLILLKIDNNTDQIIKHKKNSSKNNYTVVANNSALWLAQKEKNVDLKIKYYDEVINSKGDDVYNQIRAAAYKVNCIYSKKMQKKYAISKREQDIIRYGYSLNFSQRISSNFQICHDALWSMLKEQKSSQELIKLFRYSSIIWRLSGNEDAEISCCNDLCSYLEDTQSDTNSESRSNIFGYFLSRMAFLIQGSSH